MACHPYLGGLLPFTSRQVDLNGRKVSTRGYCSWYNFKGPDQSKKVGLTSRNLITDGLKQAGHSLQLCCPLLSPAGGHVVGRRAQPAASGQDPQAVRQPAAAG